MAKRRSCRRTANQDAIHEKAVKMRKMTDEQLVHYVEDRVRKAESEGYNKGREDAQSVTVNEKGVKRFLEEFEGVPGIGKATYLKLVKYAEENGYV